ncbi:unnamed protein product [Medioppia subpectinata]|uniref:BED-type domain-containing protein n=1 Tax=Medioppia subpectinata TaxID=1979941 RepID=A0A7R9L563_9ACAR|nr:unnamed protein product [Medioppia subpectinata]CAG2115736.1 unnamed protein product [Medioppia subpectinata]
MLQKNVCELSSNQLSGVVPHLMTDSGDGSNDETDGQHMIGDENLSQTQNVKIVKVVPLPHARSEVWSYFGFIADDDGEIQDKKKAICKICASTLAYSGNTTNLFTHLKAMHPEAQPQKLAPTNRTPRTGKKFGKRKADVLDSPSGPLIVRAITYSSHNDHMFDEDPQNGALLNSKPHKSHQNAYNSASNVSDTHNNVITTDDITNAIVNWLVKDCRPICVVEGKGFQELLRQLAPGYVVPDTRRLTTAVKKKYDEVRRDLILRAMQDE